MIDIKLEDVQLAHTDGSAIKTVGIGLSWFHDEPVLALWGEIDGGYPVIKMLPKKLYPQCMERSPFLKAVLSDRSEINRQAIKASWQQFFRYTLELAWSKKAALDGR